MRLVSITSRVLALSVLFVGSAFGQIQKTVTLLKGDVSSSEGSKIADVQVAIFKGHEKVFQTKSNSEGKFSATLQPNATYRIVLSNSQFLYREDTLSIPTLEKFRETPYAATMRPLRSGERFSLTNMVFRPNSSLIEPEAAAQLEEIAKMTKLNPKLSLQITVYPDVVGKGKQASEQQNLVASRATAVMSFLRAKGVPEKAFVIERGSTVPTERRFSLEITETQKKKQVKKTVMVPQYIEVVSKVG